MRYLMLKLQIKLATILYEKTFAMLDPWQITERGIKINLKA
jgi:hypothetical protein